MLHTPWLSPLLPPPPTPPLFPYTTLFRSFGTPAPPRHRVRQYELKTGRCPGLKAKPSFQSPSSPSSLSLWIAALKRHLTPEVVHRQALRHKKSAGDFLSLPR